MNSYALRLMLLLVVSVAPSLVTADATPSGEPLTCSASPFVQEPGESVVLRAYTSAALAETGGPPSWRAINGGEIAHHGTDTVWRFPLDAEGVFDALVTVTEGKGREWRCTARVVIAASLEHKGASPLETLWLLPRTEPPPTDFALYTYVLLSDPPTESQLPLYRSVIAESLRRNRDFEALSSLGARREDLNAVLVPVVSADNDDTVRDFRAHRYNEAADRILANYDYERASLVLLGLQLDTDRSGPILVALACVRPCPGEERDGKVVYEFAGMQPERAVELVEQVFGLAGQSDFSGSAYLRSFAMRLLGALDSIGRAVNVAYDASKHLLEVSSKVK